MLRSTRCRPVLAAGADGADPVVVAEVDLCDGDGAAEYLRLEGKGEELLHHREPAGGLLRFAVGVDRGLLDHFCESGLAETARRSRTWALHARSCHAAERT